MKEASKAFFFEKMKQKTFTPLSRDCGDRLGRFLLGAVVLGIVLVVAASAAVQGFSENILYLAIYVLLAGGALDLLDRVTYDETQHARVKQAIGVILMSMAVCAILLKVRVGYTPAYTGLVTLPAYLIAFYVIRPMWLKKLPKHDH